MASAAKLAVEDTPVVHTEENHKGGVDNAQEAAQTSTSPAEGELELSRSVAKRLGWTPKEQWTRDPDRWRDAPEFLEQTASQVEALKERAKALDERVKRTAQAAAEAIEETRRQERQKAQAELRAAAEAQDPEAATLAAEKLARVSGPPAETIAWLGRNPWFESDPEAQALAKGVVDRAARAGATISEQLEAGEAAVRKRFPEHFPKETKTEKPKEEVRLSQSNITPPAVATGSRGGSGQPKEKSFSDIPAADQGLYARHFAKKYESYMKPEEAKEKYAKAYWMNKQ